MLDNLVITYDYTDPVLDIIFHELSPLPTRVAQQVTELGRYFNVIIGSGVEPPLWMG
jgi:hypothetical protein